VKRMEKTKNDLSIIYIMMNRSYHVGDKNSFDNGGDYEPHVQIPVMLEPQYPGEIGWQTDIISLFDCIKKTK
jgi:hypothetical protein